MEDGDENEVSESLLDVMYEIEIDEYVTGSDGQQEGDRS